MASFYLSLRGAENFKGLNIPWRFAPRSENYYDRQTNPTGLITFGTAENCYIQKELKEFVAENVQISSSDFTYAGCYNGGDTFPTLMASHVNKYFSPQKPVTPANIITGNGVTAIQTMIAYSIGDKGDGILVSRPIYGRFEIDYGNVAGIKIVYIDMKGVDPFEQKVVERFEDALQKASAAGTRVRALLISNPSNPLGHCYPLETLKVLMAFCQRHQIHLISDEIYALSVFSPPNSTSPPFTSALSVNMDNLVDQNLVHVLYGMSKDFGSAGLKIGCLITRNEVLIGCCKSIIRFHGVSGPSLAIAIAILSQPEFVEKFLALSHERLREGYKLATSTFDTASIPYYRGGNAGFFLYLDLSKYLEKAMSFTKSAEDREFALAEYLWQNGLFLHPKEEHHEVPGWYRLVFSAMPLDDLKVGLDRIITALKKIELHE